jgi:hypothetical protein
MNTPYEQVANELKFLLSALSDELEQIEKTNQRTAGKRARATAQSIKKQLKFWRASLIERESNYVKKPRKEMSPEHKEKMLAAAKAARS